MATVVSRSPKLYFYTAEGVRVETPPHRGELYKHVEVITYETLSNKERKKRKQLDAIKRRNNGKAQVKVVK